MTLRVLFQTYDSDEDGKIDVVEAERMVRNLLPAARRDRVDHKWVQGQARRMLVQMDTDHDGKIDFEEFLVFSKSNPEVFGQLASHAVRHKEVAMCIDPDRAAVHTRTSPRRIAAEVAVAKSCISPLQSTMTFRPGSATVSPEGQSSPEATEAALNAEQLCMSEAAQRRSPAHLVNCGQAKTDLSAQEEHWKVIFDRYDVDGSGTLDHHEVVLLISDLLPPTSNKPNIKWVEAQVKSMFNKMDLDGDGLITFREFVAYAKNDMLLADHLSRRGKSGRPVSSPQLSNTERAMHREEDKFDDQTTRIDMQNWKATFSKYDMDRNGLLDLQEVELMLSEIMRRHRNHEPATGYIRSQARQMMVEMDRNGDGRIDFSEFEVYGQKNQRLFL